MENKLDEIKAVAKRIYDYRVETGVVDDTTMLAKCVLELADVVEVISKARWHGAKSTEKP